MKHYPEKPVGRFIRESFDNAVRAMDDIELPEGTAVLGKFGTLCQFDAGPSVKKGDMVYTADQVRAAIAADRAKGGEQFAWAVFDGEGGYDLFLYDGNESLREDFLKRNPGATYRNWVYPLFTRPAWRPRGSSSLGGSVHCGAGSPKVGVAGAERSS